MIFLQSASLPVPKRELARHHGPSQAKIGNWGGWKGLDWHTLGCSRHTTLLRKILAPRVLTGMASQTHIPTSGHLAETALGYSTSPGCLIDERLLFSVRK